MFPSRASVSIIQLTTLLSFCIFCDYRLADEPEFWWWEVTECLRRLAMTSANVFIAHAGLMKQLVINLCVALLTTKLYSYYQPYIQDSDDVLSEIAQWCLITSLIMTLLIYHGVTSDDEGDISGLGIAFIVLQLVFILVAIVMVIADIRTDMRELADAAHSDSVGRLSITAVEPRRATGRHRHSVPHGSGMLQMVTEANSENNTATETAQQIDMQKRPARDGRSLSVQPTEICWNGVAIEIPLCS